MPDDTAYLQGLIDACEPIPHGTFYATNLNVSGERTLRGSSKWTTTIHDLTEDGDLITLGAGATVRDIALRAPSMKTSGRALYHGPACHDVTLENLWIDSAFIAIYQNGGGTMRVSDINISNTFPGSDSILIDNDGGMRLTNVIADNPRPDAPRSHLHVRHAKQVILQGCAFIHAETNVLVDPDGSQAVTAFWADQSFGDKPYNAGWLFKPTNGAVIAMVKLAQCRAADGNTGGFDFDATNGVIDSVLLDGGEAVNCATFGVRAIKVKNFRVVNQDIAANEFGIVLQDVQNATIANNVIGPTGKNPENNWGIKFEGPSAKVILLGNQLSGNMVGAITGPTAGIVDVANIVDPPE